MSEVEPNWISAVAAVLSGVATIAAAIAAFLAFKLQQSLAKTREELLKGDSLLKNIQLFITTFADVHATAKEVSSEERREKLGLLSRNLQYTETIIKSLNPGIGAKIEKWRVSPDSEGNNIARVVDHALGGIGATVGDKYDDFLFAKAEELRRIQDIVFEEMRA
ncbi:hypothetical protein F1529_11495 [Alcanivorax sp. VBW004]|uniref:hypothetical protein n=1 Tax=Alcanivorax sp. VBW004 TaxID=1287708 RepID=UPI0012BB7259|nr:hypothetical protein [Alcanivorax sp. VBW004]MTT53107.1 hypothetical protein [Alcanivorax sp. VBW004]